MKKFLFSVIGIVLGFSAFTINAQENPYIVYNEGSGLITLYSTDFSYGITIQDKNLGAENVWDTGYYYQWGNNNPKTQYSVRRDEGLEWKDSYDNHGYDGDVMDFVRKQGSNYSIWEGDVVHYNVRGGGNDNDISDNNIIKGYDTVNHTVINVMGRQGPCESGYHVPSAGEWRELVKLYFLSIDRLDLFQEFESAFYGDFLYTENLDFKVKMKLPHAGVVEPPFYEGAYFWASTPDFGDSSTAGECLSFYQSYDSERSLALNYWDRTVGISVRCFKNDYEAPNLYTVDFNSNGGENLSGMSVLSGNSAELPGAIRPDYVFSGRYTELESGDFIGESGTLYNPSGDITLYARWTPVEYTITYELDGGTNSENNTGKYTIETPDIMLENPTKDGYNFEGWFSDAEFTTGVATIPTGTTGDITLYAKWTENKKPSGGSSGGGGGKSSRSSSTSDTSKNDKTPADSSAESQNGNNTQNASEPENTQGAQKTYSDEFQQAYEFAYKNGITTMPTIQKSDMEGGLTRIAMAKMLSYYAINLLGLKPDENRVNKFNDVTDEMDAQYDSGVTLAYQLGIMGINMPGNKFRPFDEVTRAEFATALSRLIYSTSDGEYELTPKYYIHHMEKLMEEKIITNNDPMMKELRGYVMIMLMRSAK